VVSYHCGGDVILRPQQRCAHAALAVSWPCPKQNKYNGTRSRHARVREGCKSGSKKERR
jgi:hypothetical protein